MDLQKLAEALIPDTDLLPIEEYDKIYPPRALEKGAEVTRIAPSPRRASRRSAPESMSMCS